MRKHAIILGLTFIGLAAFAVFAGWAFFQGSTIVGGWRSLGPIWPYVLGGCLVVAALAIVLMWLAFYSANQGYDDRVDREGP
jgi:membrane protein implicated in regulation of membrane protease activity